DGIVQAAYRGLLRWVEIDGRPWFEPGYIERVRGDAAARKILLEWDRQRRAAAHGRRDTDADDAAPLRSLDPRPIGEPADSIGPLQVQQLFGLTDAELHCVVLHHLLPWMRGADDRVWFLGPEVEAIAAIPRARAAFAAWVRRCDQSGQRVPSEF